MTRDAKFDNMLDDCYEPWTIGGMTYYPSVILFECDPIAYQVSVSDYHDSLCKDGDHESDDGKTCSWCDETMELAELDGVMSDPCAKITLPTTKEK